MKVSTDACILGAFILDPAAKTILDIGTGTALLSLMLAQRHPSAQIDAVEIEPQAYEQACINIKNSPWTERIQIHLSSIQQFSPSRHYDLIICNPPFYPRHLKSTDPQRRLAFHQESLDFADLAQAFRQLLSPNGHASILLPPSQAEELSTLLAKSGLFLQKELIIADKPSRLPHRCIRTFGLTPAHPFLKETLFIREEEGNYSPSFTRLMKDFYLIF